MKRLIEIVPLLWQIPLSVMSFLFFHLMRNIIQKGAYISLKIGFISVKGEGLGWMGISEILKKPIALPYLMVTGPRWNCHAVIGTLGPFHVKSFIEIQVEKAQKSAKQWTLIIYDRVYQTNSFLSSRNMTSGKVWEKVSLKPGRYGIALRYYDPEGEWVTFPAVKIDGMESVPSRSMRDEMEHYQTFLRKIQNRHGFFYYGLHYYVYHLLCWKKWLPESFVSKEYLPVGNPETSFYYGSMKKGDILEICFDKGLLDKANIYFAFDNRCSFPVFWETITQSRYHTGPVPCDGFYLIRVHSKCEKEADTLSDRVSCKIY